MAEKYYTVWKGKTTGIFDNWEDCKNAISGCDAKYMSFSTKIEAEKAFSEDYNIYIGKYKQKKFDYFSLSEMNRPVIPSISVDAACSGNPGVLEFRGVETATGAEVFHRGPYPEGTVNIGEFLAVVFALALLKKAGANIPIYSDSVTALSWVRNMSVNTNLSRNEKNDELFSIVDRAVNWLKNNQYPNSIIKWDTDTWGENPADFGRK